MATAERVLMNHPDTKTKKNCSVTRQSFERVWKQRGWKIVDADAAGTPDKADEGGTDEGTPSAPALSANPTVGSRPAQPTGKQES